MENRIEGITVTRERGISAEVKAFLESIAWGSEGAVYERHDITERLLSLPDPYLILLRDEEGRIAGTAVFNKRYGQVGNTRLPFYYVGFFASSPHIRGRGLIKRFGSKFMSSIREGNDEPAVYMGVIERGNHSSYQVALGAGYHEVARLKTVGFSRFFPRHSESLQPLRAADRPRMLQLLEEFYSHHVLYHTSHLFHKDNYYTLEKEGQILAGAQIYFGRWVMRKMGGPLGPFLLKVLPVLPLLRRLYNPSDFRFLTVEGLYHAPGREDALYELLEGLLHRFQHHTALIWLDERSPLYQMLLQRKNLGLVHHFTKDADARIVACYSHLTDEQQALLNQRPWYTTGFDYI